MEQVAAGAAVAAAGAAWRRGVGPRVARVRIGETRVAGGGRREVVGMRDSSLVANPEVARKHLAAQTVAPAGTRGKSPRSIRGG